MSGDIAQLRYLMLMYLVIIFFIVKPTTFKANKVGFILIVVLLLTLMYTMKPWQY